MTMSASDLGVVSFEWFRFWSYFQPLCDVMVLVFYDEYARKFCCTPSVPPLQASGKPGGGFGRCLGAATTTRVYSVIAFQALSGVPALQAARRKGAEVMVLLLMTRYCWFECVHLGGQACDRLRLGHL